MHTHETHSMHAQSMAAHESLSASGKKRARSEEVVSTLRVHGPCTVREMLKITGRHDMNELRPRVSELVHAGIIVERGVKFDVDTRKTVTVFALRPAEQLVLEHV